MAEATVITLFFIILLILQVKEQQKIQLKAKKNRIKTVIATLLALALLIIFWQNDLSNQLKLGCFAAVIFSYGFLSEGLAADHLVRLGVLSGEYSRFQRIQLEQVKANETFVTFYNRKNSSFSMRFPYSAKTLQNYFNQLEQTVEITKE